MSAIKITDQKARELTRQAMGIAIAKNKGKVISLLKKYGVAVDNSYSDDELIVGVLQAVRSGNARFKKDLAILLGEGVSMNFTAEQGSEFFSFVDSSFLNNDGAFTGINATSIASQYDTTASTAKEKTAVGSLLSDKNFLSGVLNTGLTTLSSSLTNKSNQKLANTALQIEAERTKQAALIAAGGGAAGLGVKPGLSTGAKVAIGVGVLAIVGVIIYVVVKK